MAGAHRQRPEHVEKLIAHHERQLAGSDLPARGAGVTADSWQDHHDQITPAEFAVLAPLPLWQILLRTAGIALLIAMIFGPLAILFIAGATA